MSPRTLATDVISVLGFSHSLLVVYVLDRQLLLNVISKYSAIININTRLWAQSQLRINRKLDYFFDSFD